MFSFFLIIVSCDPCDDCNSVTFEPTVSFVFINQDSIVKIDNCLTIIENIDAHISANIHSLQSLRDSLQRIKDIIKNGGILGQLKMTIQDLIDLKQTDSLLLATKNDRRNTIIPELNRAKVAINSGLILVSEIAILGTNYAKTYRDSLKVWSIPLSYDKDFTRYKITINNVSEIIELSYDNFQELDGNRNILTHAKNIQVIEKSYIKIDSVKPNCIENCIDGEATFTFYF